MIEIQTAGKKTTKHKYLNGPYIPPNALIIHANTLKNPFNSVTSRFCRQSIEETKQFLKRECASKTKKMIIKGIEAIKNGKPIVILCTFGKHRSRAIAEMIGDNFHCSKVYYNHRECPYIIPL